MLLDGAAEQSGEALALAQQARHQEVEQGPELAEVVLQRRAGEGKALAGFEGGGRNGRLRPWIFDLLRFIEDQQVKMVSA
ncbi:MAG TPA: hypothetical protein VFY81_05000 [Gammaproteobacteria bacterium]|nr:hypothetical protein [Gammaproteobacteria bacterium]